MSEKLSKIELAQLNWDRYQYGLQSGHDDYQENARRNDDFYLGGGSQWSEEDKQIMRESNRPIIELNHIMPVIQTALGLQLHSRVDIAFKPRNDGADEEVARILSKVAMQICDNIEYRWKESCMYEDGLIQQRGFLDFRISYDSNMMGDIECDVLDPLDVIPDPDAQGYDPSTWQDVLVVRWLTYDEITQAYGEDKAKEVQYIANEYIEDNQYQIKSHFGSNVTGDGYELYRGWIKQETRSQLTRYMVIDRQYWRLHRENVIIKSTGEIIPQDSLTPEQLQALLTDESCIQTVYNNRKVRWTVTCGEAVLFDEWSPYTTFTIIPYFPIFRRGRTRGLVDNLRSPQELENKSITSYLEILNTTANSGWDIEEGSLTNMTTEELQTYGSRSGVVLEFSRSCQRPPVRRAPNQPPRGAEILTSRAEAAIKTISGMSDAVQGQPGPEVSGVAIEARQYHGELQLGRPLDNLAYSRRLAAKKILELIQHFYTEERLIKITDSQTGEHKEDIIINEVDEYGRILNDVTTGNYDLVITDTPTHATYRQNQFDQLIRLVEKNVPIPPQYLIQASNIDNKHDIAKQLSQSPSDPVRDAEAAERQAKAELNKALANKANVDATNVNVEALYSAMQAAGIIAQTPETAPLADKLLLSAGYQDQDQPPIVPEYTGTTTVGDEETQQMAQEIPPESFNIHSPHTNPTTPIPPPKPESAATGHSQGIETQRID